MSFTNQRLAMAVAKPLLASNYNKQNFTLGRMSLQMKPSVISGRHNLLFSSHSQRNFSSGAAMEQSSTGGSIFESADFLKEVESESISEQISNTSQLPWIDGNDTFGSLLNILPKDLSSLPTGMSSYGFSEYILWLDTLFYDGWMFFADTQQMGMCYGLMSVALLTRFAFIPLQLYGQIIGQKMKLLQPDNEESQAVMKRYNQQGNKEAVKIERQKMKSVRRTHGLYPIVSALNIFQLPVHMVYISMINRLSYDYEINPAILTDGILWFKDLSSPDPYGILPIFGGLFSMLNMMSTNAGGGNTQMRKMSKFLRLLPLISVPIWMTFPAAFNVYWLVTSIVQFCVLNSLRISKMRKACGIPEFLPGTILERANVKNTMKVFKPEIFTKQQSQKKLTEAAKMQAKLKITK